jgi:hypothetical protein
LRFQVDDEHSADSLRRFHMHLSSLLVYYAFADAQTEASSFFVQVRVLIQLSEVHEEIGLSFLAYTSTCVNDFDCQVDITLIVAQSHEINDFFCLKFNCDRASFRCELQSVGQEIQQNLEKVIEVLWVLYNCLHFDVFLEGSCLDDLKSLLDHLRQRKVVVIEPEDSLLELAEVHQVVDQVLHHALAEANVLEQVACLFLENFKFL